ncbi:hypothetical protein [Aquisalimonas sp.]|uniref:hypothetical protein n=1 Tax=Aquisalimonas sp. TaxID=1872621 RepID=UPI0025C22A9B|nr:hypothetical protein [Aquisalimonas sp.]
MANSKQPQQAASKTTPVDLTAFAESWTTAIKEAEQRMQRMQELTSELQEVMQNASRAQVDDLVKTGDRINKTFAKAAENREPTAMISVQPELFSCFMEAAQTTNQRWLDLMEQLQVSSMRAMTNGDTGSAHTQSTQQQSATVDSSPADEVAAR